MVVEVGFRVHRMHARLCALLTTVFFGLFIGIVCVFFVQPQRALHTIVLRRLHAFEKLPFPAVTCRGHVSGHTQLNTVKNKSFCEDICAKTRLK